MGQICIPNGDACYDCSEYAGAFACLNKIKVSGMDRISELGILTALDSKCEDILIPVSKISCEGAPETLSMSLKDLIEITNSTSVGERQAFPDKKFTAEGQSEEYELAVFNPSETRSMQMTYFAHWSSNMSSSNARKLVGIDSIITIDDKELVNGVLDYEIIGDARRNLQGGYDTFVAFNSDGYHNQDASSMPFFYTAIIPPKTETKIKMKIVCTSLDGENAVAETIQLMITGTTR